MKKVLFCLMLFFSFFSLAEYQSSTPSTDLSTIKKEKYKPDGKEIFILNEFSLSSGMLVKTSLKSKTTLLQIQKYGGMEGYVDKIISTDIYNYKKVIFKNGDVFYLSSDILKEKYDSDKLLITPEEYKKISKMVEDTKKLKLQNINDVSIQKVIVEKDDIYNVRLSNGLVLDWNVFEALQNLTRRINNETDSRLLLTALKNDVISLKYDHIDNIYQVTMSGNSPLEMYLNISSSWTITPIVEIRYHGSEWVFANSFVVFQNEKRLARDNVIFKRYSSSNVDEWYDFVCSKEDIDSIRLLDENGSAIVRFYGSDYKADKEVSKESIKKIKGIIALYDMLTKYFEVNFNTLS